MIVYINELVKILKDIIHQMTEEKLVLDSIRVKKDITIKESVVIVSGICNKSKSMQIILNISRELAKRLSSKAMNGVPIAILDENSKNKIMSIVKVVISDLIIKCQDTIEENFTIQPCIIEADNLFYSCEGLIVILKFKLLNEYINVLIMPINDIEDLQSIRSITKKYID